MHFSDNFGLKPEVRGAAQRLGAPRPRTQRACGAATALLSAAVAAKIGGRDQNKVRSRLTFKQKRKNVFFLSIVVRMCLLYVNSFINNWNLRISVKFSQALVQNHCRCIKDRVLRTLVAWLLHLPVASLQKQMAAPNVSPKIRIMAFSRFCTECFLRSAVCNSCSLP